MKGWEQDLLDHLVWLTVLHSDTQLTLDEIVARVKHEIPCLAAADSPLEGLRSDCPRLS